MIVDLTVEELNLTKLAVLLVLFKPEEYFTPSMLTRNCDVLWSVDSKISTILSNLKPKQDSDRCLCGGVGCNSYERRGW